MKGALHAVADLAATTFDVVRNVGKLSSDILHLNLADIIADLGNIGINILQLLVWGVRLVTGAYFGKEVSDYFMRDRALTFIRNLIIDEFGNKDGEDILRKLGSGSLHFGLPIAASTRIMAADSNTFPFDRIKMELRFASPSLVMWTGKMASPVAASSSAGRATSPLAAGPTRPTPSSAASCWPTSLATISASRMPATTALIKS